MSTVKATYIQHPSASSPNFTLASDGTVSGGAGLGGLVHIHTESFSAVSSVSIDDVFDATYNNYRLILDTTTTANVEWSLRLRVSGADNSTANSYVTQKLTASASTVSGSRTTSDNWSFGEHQNVQANGHDAIIWRPFAAEKTSFWNNTAATSSSAYLSIRTGTHNQATSYDGFTIYQASGTFSGTLRVYGYAND
jgi:hypothetical protein